MSKDDQPIPDPRIVEKLLENFRLDGDLEVKRQEIGSQIAELSAKWAEARKRGDAALCEEIESRMTELVNARNEVG